MNKQLVNTSRLTELDNGNLAFLSISIRLLVFIKLMSFCRFSSDKLANVADFRMLMAVKNKHVFLCGAAVTHEPLVAACAVEISAEWKQPY